MTDAPQHRIATPGGETARLEALIAEQRAEIAFVRKRTGWVLVWAFLAALGSCQGNSSSSNNSTAQLTVDVEQMRQSVDQLVQENAALRQQIAKAGATRPAPASSGPSSARTSH